MRKHLIWALGLVVALASVGIASAVPNDQKIEGVIAPKKLPKKGKKTPVSINVDVRATNPGNPNQLPNPTTNAKVDFDKDLAIQQKGYPTCPEDGSDPRQTFGAAATTQEVRQECPDSIIGSGAATVAVPGAPGAPPTLIQADVVAANVSKNRLLLHSYNTTTGATPLVAQLSKQGGKYGTLLDVDVPPLGGGIGVITQFQTKIDKTVYRYRGKKLAIVASSCKDKKIEFQARFLDDEGQLATGTDSFPCKQKKVRKKKN